MSKTTEAILFVPPALHEDASYEPYSKFYLESRGLGRILSHHRFKASYSFFIKYRFFSLSYSITSGYTIFLFHCSALILKSLITFFVLRYGLTM
jgi:hypothetical protein